jgi:arylsulfatase A-like enzyme
MNEAPPRRLTAATYLGAAALSGALFGGAEAARVIVGGRLLMSDASVVALLVVGALGGAVLSGASAVVLAALPVRPLGRARWLGFLWGLFVPVLGSIAVPWFTDPPPFTEPFRFQGNVPVFVLLVAGIAGLFLVIYQGARGARRVAGAALALAVGLAAWVTGAARSLPAPSAAPPAGAPNVLLVTLDTTRADRMGAFGNEQVQTKAFDGVAKEGTLFTAASAVAPVTGPSHASMLLGRGPWDHGVLLNGVPLPDSPMLAEVLHDHGYATGAFVSAYVLDGSLGFARGFEVYDDDFGWLPGGSSLLPARMWAMLRRHADPDEVLERRGGDTVDQALAWLAQRPDGAYFLWVHLFDAHGPYTPPPPYDTLYYQGDEKDPANTSMKQVKNVAPYLLKSLAGVTDLRWVLAQYDGEVSYADSQLARLLAAVDPKNTLVAVIGDHGEALGEHDVWFNHGDDVYETSVHVPFALRWPGRVPAGQTVASPVEGDDLAPTLLDLVGITPPKQMTGKSAVPTLQGGPGRTIAHSFCFDRPANQAARAAGTITGPKYRVAGLRGPSSRYVMREVDQSAAYFDLSSDPSGLQDVSATTAATPEGTELLGLLRGQAEGLFSGDATERSAVELSPEERARLESLGYMEQ